jgi:thiamine-monophosphate kinase
MAADNQPRGELELVRRIAALLAPPDGAAAPTVRFGDDMAAADGPLLWTVDMLMDGVDFDSRVHGWPAIGRKAMAVNLSDCAAMGATPASAVCAVALSNRLSMDEAVALHRGAHECGLAFGCPIVGGDTNSWDHPTVISITVAARCDAGASPVPRDGARPGDQLWVTGCVGGSLLGRHLTFEPRVALGREIARRLAPHAMIDISDGLVLDLWRILDASGCGAVLDETALAAATHADAHRAAVQDGRSARAHALYDGEDFELLVALPPGTSADVCRRLGSLRLGDFTADAGRVLLRQADGVERELPVRGWEHFR